MLSLSFSSSLMSSLSLLRLKNRISHEQRELLTTKRASPLSAPCPSALRGFSKKRHGNSIVRRFHGVILTLIALHCCDSTGHLMPSSQKQDLESPGLFGRFPFLLQTAFQAIAQRLLMKPAPLSNLIIHLIIYLTSFHRIVNCDKTVYKKFLCRMPRTPGMPLLQEGTRTSAWRIRCCYSRSPPLRKPQAPKSGNRPTFPPRSPL